jgi:iron complex outermembrane receptor protein
MKSIKRTIKINALALGSLALMPLAVHNAHAQQVDGDKVQRVEVTGSNIRRSDKETPSPVQIITLQDLKASGYTDVSSVLRNITANGAGTLSQSFNGAFSSGASGVALRGLTVGATLVLIDGHRMAPYALSDDGQRSFVDISQIPFEAIDRIEVLKDGASSVYGSDAVAGVVNVILKKTYVGQEIAAETGISTRGGGATSHASGIIGWGDLAEDGRNTYLSIEYRKQDKILVSQRSGMAFTNTDLTSQGGNNLTSGVPNNLNAGYPGSITGYLLDPVSGNISGFLPGCDATRLAAGQCAYRNANIEIQPQTRNINIVGSHTQRLAGDWELKLKGSLFDSQAEQINGYSSTGGLSGLSSVAYKPGGIPYITPANAPLLITVPSSYPGNRTGASQVLQYNFANLGGSSTSVDSQTYRFVGDLTGTIGKWDMTASAGFTENIVKQTGHGSINFLNLQSALNNPTTPYLVGQAAGGNSAAANAFVAPKTNSKATDILEFVSLRGTRELMALPGGPLAVGVGTEFTHRELNAQAADAFANGTQVGNNAFAIGNQNIAAAYVELVAPVLKSLELDGAVRFDKYNGSSSATSPKVGFKFAPLKIVTLRGTYAEGFRAPNPAENGNAGQSFYYTTYRDNTLCPNTSPGVDPATLAGNYPRQCAIGLLGVQQPNAKLKPETSKSYTLGIIFEPTRQFNLSADFYDIRINNQIISSSGDPTYSFAGNLVRSSPTIQPFNGAGGSVNQTPGAGNILFAPFPYVNAQSTHTRGIDFDVRYTMNLNAAGKLTVEFNESHMFKYEQVGADGTVYQLAGTHGPSGVSGDTGNPRDRAHLITTWERGPLTVAGTVNWISSFKVTDPTVGAVDCASAINGSFSGPAFSAAVPAQYCRVASFTTLDVYSSYKYDKNWTFHASVQNALNKAPPLDYQTYGGAGGTFFDAGLHQAGAVGRFINIGAAYKF